MTLKRHTPPVTEESAPGRHAPPATSVHAPAKLNLRLKVVGIRADGYHDLDSLMVPVNILDVLTFGPGPAGMRLSCRGIPVPGDEENLVLRAARAFFSRLGRAPSVSISLTKNIPVAAGLGGGSSDAAATLKALNRMYGDPLAHAEMGEMALRLGADVPFFLSNVPSIARGVGERLEPIGHWQKLWYVIVTPPLSVSTAWVYGNLKLELTNPGYDSIVNPLEEYWPAMASLLENDLEAVTAARYPVITSIKEILLNSGAEGALMSGSGPSVFGVFRSEEGARRAKNAVSSQVVGKVFLAGSYEEKT